MIQTLTHIEEPIHHTERMFWIVVISCSFIILASFAFILVTLLRGSLYVRISNALPNLHPINWLNYYQSDGNFSIAFPQAPKEQTNSIPITNSSYIHTYLYSAGSTDSREQYIATYIAYPNRYTITNNTQTLLKMEQGAVSSNTKSTLLKSKLERFYGKDGEEFTIKTNTNNEIQYERNRIVIENGNAYILEVISTNSSIPNYNTFVGSFSIN